MGCLEKTVSFWMLRKVRRWRVSERTSGVSYS